MNQDLELFRKYNGVHIRLEEGLHREGDYEEEGFDILIKMQREHFWYQGRHRFLLGALRKTLSRFRLPAETLRVIDLGGGCGGWPDYLINRSSLRFKELAIGDSSLKALTYASRFLGSDTGRFQMDLLRLGWRDRWDVVFLLDVLEHIPEDTSVLCQIRESLTPGGLLFVAAPALQFFWSHNDEIVNHKRRYSRRDFRRLAGESGLKPIFTRYFNFFLSPLLYISRLRNPKIEAMSHEERLALLRRTHRIPNRPLNEILRLVFSLETPLGLGLPFPWGTSILGIFQREA